MPLAQGDIFQVAAVGRCFGQRVMLTHNYVLDSFNPGTTEDQARDSLILGVSNAVTGGDVLESTYLALLPEDYVLDYWRCQLIDPVRRAYINLTRNVQGTHGAVAHTVNCGIGITLRSNDTGRKEHCTKHVGPVPEDVTVMVQGLFTTAYKTVANTFLGSLLSHVIDAALGLDFTPIIYNKGEAPLNYAVATMGFVGDTVRVQRRRTVGLGE